MTILHTDPGRGPARLSLDPSRPADEHPRLGYKKINAAMQIGGATLAIRTINKLLGRKLPINHVVFVDFNQFVGLIDAVGGITVNVPENILSEQVRLPVPGARALPQWKGWRFHKGRRT